MMKINFIQVKSNIRISHFNQHKNKMLGIQKIQKNNKYFAMLKEIQMMMKSGDFEFK